MSHVEIRDIESLHSVKFADCTAVSLWSSFVLVEGEESSGHVWQEAGLGLAPLQ